MNTKGAADMNLYNMGFISTYEPKSKVVNYNGCMLDVPSYTTYVCIDCLGRVWALSDTPEWDETRSTWNPERVRDGIVVGTINKWFHGQNVGPSLQYVGE